METYDEGIVARGESGFVEVSVVLFGAPTWYGERWWSDHRLDHVDPTAPVREKPSATFRVPIDVTLADVLDYGAQVLGLRAGPDQLALEGRPFSSVYRRIGFVRVEDEGEARHSDTYAWPTALQIATSDGNIDERTSGEVTYRELLVSSALGTIEGDVTRPYLTPWMSQGLFGDEVELVHWSAEAIRAVHALLPAPSDASWSAVQAFRDALPTIVRGMDRSLPVAREVTDDAMRLSFWLGLGAAGRRLFRRSRH